MSSSEKICVNPTAPTLDVINQAASVLEAGGLVVAPTETRYGLLARADRQECMEQLCRVKVRSQDMPLALFVPSPADLDQFGHVRPKVQRLIDHFLPGPLTIVLAARTDWDPPRVQDGKIGLRCSSAPFIQQLTSQVSFPLSATSANLSGAPDSKTIDEIQSAFGNQVQLYIDGGRLEGPVSTVVDGSIQPVRILREGSISSQEILKAAGEDDDLGS